MPGSKVKPMHNAIPIHLAVHATRRFVEQSGPKFRTRTRRPKRV